jgi:hypothetical protein
MIFIHLVIGLILGKLTNSYLPFVLGSILPDVDHIYIILRHKLYKNKFRKLIDSIKNEEKYKIRYKTPLVHSILGLIAFSIIFFIIINNLTHTIYFALAYFLHLLLDWLDKDIKYYLYPLKIKFKGYLDIWSKTERIATLILILILVAIYML